MSDTPTGNDVPPSHAITNTPPPLVPTGESVQPPPQVKDPSAGIAARREASVRFDRVLLLLERAHIPIVLVIAFLLASFAVRNSDFWMHLATGKKIVAGEYKFFGAGNDPFSYGTESMRWINHSWLYEVLIYGLWSLGGGTATVVVKALLVALMAGVLRWTCRPPQEERIQPGAKANPTGWLAAILVVVALIAVAPRLLLQPVILSYLFLALTVFILTRKHNPARPWQMPVALAALSAVWVNCDGWFLLGPLAVLLFLIGEVLQRLIPMPAQTKDWTRVRTVGIALAAGRGACLLNPDFHRAFELPAEIYAVEVPNSLRTDVQFKNVFVSPIDGIYRSDFRYGKNPVGLAYASFVVLTLAAFAVNYPHFRWSQILLTIGFAALSLRNTRAIPFFAIVAAPITVLNLNWWFSRLSERTFEEPEPAAPTPISAAPPKQAGAITLTPARIVAFLGLTGRLLTLVLAVLAAGLAYFGRLHTNPYFMTSAQPAAWTAEPDPSIMRAVKQIQQWRDSGELPADVRGVHMHPEIANYCAWFAPSEKNLMDYRIKFQAGRANDYFQMRRELYRDSGATVSDELQAILRKYQIGYIVASWSASADIDDWGQLTEQLYLNDADWVLWRMDGKVAIAGWNGALSHPNLKIDFVQQAFGPKQEKVPPKPKGRLIATEDGKLEWPSPFENYIYPAQPAAPESIASTVYLTLFREINRLTQLRIRGEYHYAVAASVAGHVCDGTLWSVVWRYFTSAYAESTIPEQAWMRDDKLAALPLLAVRSARHSVAKQPDDPLPYIVLSNASKHFLVGGPVSATQRIGVLRQGLARVAANEDRSRGFERLITDSYVELANDYLTPTMDPVLQQPVVSMDLAVECLHEVHRRFRAAPPTTVPADRLEESEKQLADQIKAIESNLRPAQENFILGAKGKPIMQQFYRARLSGLTRDALRVLYDRRLDNVLGPDGAYELVRMFLVLGQVDDAQSYLDLIKVEDFPQQFHMPFRVLQVETSIAAGQLDKAGSELEKIIATIQSQAATLPLSLHQVMHGPIAVELVDPHMAPMAREWLRWLWLSSWQPSVMQLWSTLASLNAQRGMIALEEGDNAKALEYLQKAVDIRLFFDGRPFAERYLALLKRESDKQ